MTSLIRNSATKRNLALLQQPWYSIVRVVLIVLAVIFPILPLNVIALGNLQRHVNEIYEADEQEQNLPFDDADVQAI